MSDVPLLGRTGNPEQDQVPEGDYVPYDGGNLSYAGTFTDPFKVNVIRTLEWMTGKLHLLRLIRRFEREGVETGQAFFAHALRVMNIRIDTPAEQISRIPATGPLVVVANHPHGLVDGIVLADLIGRVRTDYRILTRSLLTDVPEVADFMIPVPFPHEADARERNLEMRRLAMAHLSDGGCIVVFPAGAVAASETAFGPAIEKPWNPFTGKMIRRSGATIVPVYFRGRNSRAYQIANRISATLRQGLLLHEVVHALGKPQVPVIRAPLHPDDWGPMAGNASDFMDWLRDRTIKG